MRILQVVTYISPDGAYGGPVRVAINQAKALTELGHEVIVAAAAGGFGTPLPEEYDGYPVRLFPSRRIIPKTGFAGMTSPALIRWLVEAIRSADVVHVHLARDLVSLPSAALALLLKKPLVVQTHGMIDPSTNHLAKPLDAVMTRAVLSRASTVLYLTEQEQHGLVVVASTALRLKHLPNGVVVEDLLANEQMNGPEPKPEVLYLARLQVRKRPKLIVDSAVELKDKWPFVRWSIVGPDEGEGKKVLTAIEDGNLSNVASWEGFVPPSETTRRMQTASVYALPSKHEPFPMSVLEAMSIGLPVVVTKTCGLAPIVEENDAGIVCDHSAEGFTAALSALLENPNRRIEMGANARRAVQTLYSMRLVSERLTEVYTTAIQRKEIGR